MRLNVGDQAPFFSQIDDAQKTVTLEDYADRQLLIYFYPKAFTPGCTGESCDFRDRYELFLAAGYAILGVSPDTSERLAEFRKEYALPFSLLSDPDHTMASAYGAWGPKVNYGREYEGLIRSTFEIAGDGAISAVWYNVRAKGHAARIQREVLDD